MKTEKLIFLAVIGAVLYAVFSEKPKFDPTYGGVVGKFGPGGTLGPTGDFVPGGGDATGGGGATGSW